MSGNECADGRDEVGSRGVPPEEFVARLARGEHPAAEMYTIMTPVPNPMPVPDDAEEWIAAFGRVITGGHLPGGDGKTSMTMIVDTDPQGTAATPLGGPGLDLCRTCLTPVGEPSAECTNPFNHQEQQA
ncbi:hypothetical protein ACPCSC_30630 [Streptomyces lavendulocolor]|uniref:hypothetical protein n=1 Tax=Streptomyces lavendulocolor TaxID=67316 RepID=UPI003C2C6481